MTEHIVAEWDYLEFRDRVENPCEEITYDNALKLSEVAEKLPISEKTSGGVLRLHHNRISARGVVGIVHTEACTLEILPKIALNCDEGIEKDKDEIRKRLVHMLFVALNMNVDVGPVSLIDWQRDTLLEIIIGIFTSKLYDAVKLGLPQKYIEFEDDLPILMGTLDIPRQFTVHAVNPSILACNFDNFSHDIPLNQVMKSAVTFLSQVSKNTRNLKQLRELNYIFADITYVPAKNLKWDLISIDRTNERWRTLFSLAELLLRQMYQTTTQGGVEGFALLFEMNKLFEQYIGQLVRKVTFQKSTCEHMAVKLQPRSMFCLYENSNNDPRFYIKPDIVIEKGKSEIHIIDTKWKSIASKDADIWDCVDHGDIYQMIAYAEIYKSNRITLLYPHNIELIKKGLQVDGCISTNPDRSLEIASFDLSMTGGEKERIEDLLLGRSDYSLKSPKNKHK